MEHVPLPIDEVLPRLAAALAGGGCAVLAAPPGAGKTTRVPPLLARQPWAATGRIVMLEPRRLAARAAAERMAEEAGEPVGRRVGYRIRGESKVSAATRIEVVTEGVLTRMLQADPELPGVAAVVFDEVHERSIHSDLGLALAREVQAALRPELRLVAMSATLDTARFAALMGGAPVIESAGRMFPVETRWLDHPAGPGTRIEDAAADLVTRAMAEEAQGDALVFLPGAGEIARVEARLSGRLPDVALRPLHGSMDFARQRAALMPEAAGRRRVVLATSIAETSLTVEGVRIVVDCGRSRRSRFSPATGLSRLVTVPVSRAEAAQRRGRAGRLGPGVCYRMWTKGEEGALPAFAPPEILEADLAGLALELAAWGVADPAGMAFADPPPAPALAEARAVLERLGALGADGAITAHGREMAGVAAHPRLAHMWLTARARGLGAEAALLAAILGERDPLHADGPAPADLGLRIEAVTDPRRFEAAHPMRVNRGTAERIRAEARRLDSGRVDAARAKTEAGALLSLAYPDRVGKRRAGEAPRYLLANGRGAELSAGDPLGAAALIVATEVEDRGRDARIRHGAALAEAELRALHGAAIGWHAHIAWSRRARAVEAVRRETFGAVVLREEPLRDAPADALGHALADGLRERGLAVLNWTDAAASLRDQVRWLAAQGTGGLAARLPDWSDHGLLAGLDDWLTPHLAGMRRVEDAARIDVAAVLRAALGWELAAEVDRAAPTHFETPLGGRARIDYGREIPTVSIRVQELFGVTRHPCVGEPPVALSLELLSPAHRPVQVTRDLPGFWASSYADVRKDMRARYPKHPWPENPAEAAPTRRAKPRS
ncbi:ATP-dependent helicase HrpB [Limibaculum sp. M0105]|uniref:ATP-dependent helicase HrpB n=1 Tax=Thermohalobaculum xanthum TaxID=2753746 RepID=A0A8J7M9Q0_9RHOB|nr:ATP-dependent helicase HrpB [Thermohalobaculum xanthum]MBK0400825.1 ATP-dependent helicase HrpB [Thermohalobaculum xanthum]